MEGLTSNEVLKGNPFDVPQDPESRRQAIQQFAEAPIGLKSKDLQYSDWGISHNYNGDISKPTESNINDDSWKDLSSKSILDDVEMKKGCIDTVRVFYDEGRDLDYEGRGLEGRCEIVSAFYIDIKEKMGIDAELCFANKPPYDLGAYNPQTNIIELNSKYLEKSNCKDLLNTILHESRHAFQAKCIENPDSVKVKNNIIDVWKDNFDNYIPPQFDVEAYENQEIEKDANYFADSVMKKGIDQYYAS